MSNLVLDLSSFQTSLDGLIEAINQNTVTQLKILHLLESLETRTTEHSASTPSAADAASDPQNELTGKSSQDPPKETSSVEETSPSDPVIQSLFDHIQEGKSPTAGPEAPSQKTKSSDSSSAWDMLDESPYPSPEDSTQSTTNPESTEPAEEPDNFPFTLSKAPNSPLETSDPSSTVSSEAPKAPAEDSSDSSDPAGEARKAGESNTNTSTDSTNFSIYDPNKTKLRGKIQETTAAIIELYVDPVKGGQAIDRILQDNGADPEVPTMHSVPEDRLEHLYQDLQHKYTDAYRTHLKHHSEHQIGFGKLPVPDSMIEEYQQQEERKAKQKEAAKPKASKKTKKPSKKTVETDTTETPKHS